MKNTIGNIQILRALAALMVVYFHTIGTLNSYQLGTNFSHQAWAYEWGAFGVDIFFIISGFIMGTPISISCKTQSISLKKGL